MPKGIYYKLTADETAYIHMRGNKGVCMSALARKFGVSRQRIHQIVRGK